MRNAAFVILPLLTFLLAAGCILLFSAWQRALRKLARAEEKIVGLEATFGAVTGMGVPLDG